MEATQSPRYGASRQKKYETLKEAGQAIYGINICMTINFTF